MSNTLSFFFFCSHLQLFPSFNKLGRFKILLKRIINCHLHFLFWDGPTNTFESKKKRILINNLPSTFFPPSPFVREYWRSLNRAFFTDASRNMATITVRIIFPPFNSENHIGPRTHSRIRIVYVRIRNINVLLL